MSITFAKNVVRYMVSGVGVCIADLSIRIGCWKSAKYLHNRVLRTIMRVPLTFMDITPIGRILSRFSKDTDVVDNTLPFELSDLIYCLGDVRFIFSVYFLLVFDISSGLDCILLITSCYSYRYINPVYRTKGETLIRVFNEEQ